MMIGFLMLLNLILPLGFAVFAQEPANNPVGVHLSDLSEDQLKSASIAVNGQGGAWGYVTVAITLTQCQSPEMQQFFNSARKKKLMPIIRLTTDFDVAKGVYKRVENDELARQWTDCLGKLIWPSKERHVVLFNEVNHGSEYEGGCDPVHYAQVARSYAQHLHEANPNFIVMLAGLDLYAPHSPPQFCDAGIFMKDMIAVVPDLYDHIDALASHSYPAGDFTAPPISAGRRSIAGYAWELQELSRLGVNKALPVYITETGWRHGRLSESTVAEYTKTAYEQYWSTDSRVKAVTPFILSYCGVPFVDFSWKKCLPNQNGGYDVDYGFKPVYETLTQMPKKNGDPAQIHIATLIATLPKKITVGGPYRLSLTLENDKESTAIWDSRDGYNLALIDNKNAATSFANLYELEPGQKTEVAFSFLPSSALGAQTISFGLFKENKLLLKLADWSPTVFPAQTLSLTLRQFPGINLNDCGLTLKIIDPNDRISYQSDSLCAKSGSVVDDEVKGVILDETYRVKVEKEGYLPVEGTVVFDQTARQLEMPMMLPFDRNGDGKLSFSDLKR